MGNAFLQMFMRTAPAALKAVQGFGAKAAPQAVKQVLDTATNPQTYRALASKAENVLQRGLPGQFAGPNFGSIPARFTGLISDVANMPAGIQRSTQAGMVNRAIQESAGAVPQLARSVQQYATGALRAPVIGDAMRTGQAVLTSPLQTAIQTGGQFARDPGLRREFLKQFGGSSQRAVDALSRGAVNPSAVGGLFRNLGNVSSVFQAIPGPTWAKTTGAALLGGGTSIGGTLASLAFLEGSSPQSADPYDRWQQLGYGSKEDMRRRIQLQAQVEGNQKATEQFGPGIPNGLIDRSAVAPPRLDTPSASGALTDASSGRQQTGQLSPPPPNLPVGPGAVSNGAGVPAQRQNVQQRQLSQEVLNAAQQYAAPASVSLPSFYEGQQQLGRSMEQTGELQRQLRELGGAAGMSDQALMSWAKANPGLAYRELMKLKGRNQ
jgi:hypothetical protein